MKVHNTHLRLTGSPEGIRHLVQILKQLADCRVVEESYIIQNRTGPFFRQYVTVFTVEEDCSERK